MKKLNHAVPKLFALLVALVVTIAVLPSQAAWGFS